MYTNDIELHGLKTLGAQRQEVANPSIAARNKARLLLKSALSELGMSPASESKLGLIEAKTQNSLASLRERTQEHT